MKRLIIIIPILVNIIGYTQSFNYPIAPEEFSSNNYHGKEIIDPYQWMENSSDPRLSLWLKDQAEVTKKYERSLVYSYELAEQIKNTSDVFYAENEDDEEPEEPEKTFYFALGSLNTTATNDLYYKRGKNGNYSKLIETKNFKKFKSDNVVITNWELNKEETILAFQISHSGSDWREIYFYDFENRALLNDTVQYIRSTEVIWKNDGIIYLRYDEPEKGKELLDIRTGQRVCYHKLGTQQKHDVVLFKNPDSTGKNFIGITQLDSTELLINYPKVINENWYLSMNTVNLNQDDFNPIEFLLLPPNINFSLMATFGDSLVFKTNLNAPNNRVLMALKNKKNKVFELVPEYANTLTNVDKLNDNLIACTYLINGQNTVLLVDLNGNIIQRLNFPVGKSISSFHSRKNSNFAYYTIKSFYHPSIVYKLDLRSYESKPYTSLELTFNYKDFTTDYIKYKSADGTEIPAYITYRKNLDLKNGKNPCLIYGYGGYGTILQPYYTEETILWLLNGGILVVPNIRGGGANGSEWAEAGRNLNKGKSIEDFAYAAKYLVDNGISKPEKIAIEGGSHGGLIVAAAVTKYPDFFGAAIASAGVYDLLRFENFTVGGVGLNLNEFGSVTVKEEFENLYSISPYQSIKNTKYPTMLILTGDNDDRVPPLHSYKFAAKMQKMSPESRILLKVIEGAGHFGALTSDEYLKSRVLRYYFLFNELGVTFRKW